MYRVYLLYIYFFVRRYFFRHYIGAAKKQKIASVRSIQLARSLVRKKKNKKHKMLDLGDRF